MRIRAHWTPAVSSGARCSSSWPASFGMVFRVGMTYDLLVITRRSTQQFCVVLALAASLSAPACGTALLQTRIRGAEWLATAAAGDVAIGYGVYRVRIADESAPDFDGVKLLTSTLLTFGADLVGLLIYGTALRGL